MRGWAGCGGEGHGHRHPQGRAAGRAWPGAGLALGALVWLLAGCASAPPAPQPVARGDEAAVVAQLRGFIAHELRQSKAAGLSIALVQGPRVVWAEGFGLADAASGRPADAHTLYRVGSISKLFTDTAAMQLVAQGRLALDAPVSAAWPGWRLASRFDAAPGAGPGTGPTGPTLRQLMSHQAGLPRDALGGMWGTAVGDWRDTAAALGGLGGLGGLGTAAAPPLQAIAPPGVVVAYSNLGLDVVGALVERAAGVPFALHLRRALLDPLGFSPEAGFMAAPLEGDSRMARAHRAGRPVDEPALRDLPAGGLTASVSDLARFVALQLNQGRLPDGQALLPAAQWAQMLQPQTAGLAVEVGFDVGLGWMLATFGSDTVQGGGPVAHHGGATFYHRAQLLVLPQAGVGVVVASNDSAAGAAVNRIAQRAAALLLQAHTGVAQPPRQPGYRPAAQPWTAAQRQACVGDWLTPAGVARLQLHGEQLRAQLDGATLVLDEGEDGWAGLRLRVGGLLSLALPGLEQVGLQCREVQGQPLLLGRLDGQQLRLGSRLPPPEPLPPAWQQADGQPRMLGDYEPELQPGEVPTVRRATLLQADGRLWVRMQLHEAFAGAGDGRRLPLLPLPSVPEVPAGPASAHAPAGAAALPPGALAAVMPGPLAGQGELLLAWPARQPGEPDRVWAGGLWLRRLVAGP